MTKARLYYNSNIPYGGWDIYIPEPYSDQYWKKVWLESTREAAVQYINNQGWRLEE